MKPGTWNSIWVSPLIGQPEVLPRCISRKLNWSRVSRIGTGTLMGDAHVSNRGFIWWAHHFIPTRRPSISFIFEFFLWWLFEKEIFLYFSKIFLLGGIVAQWEGHHLDAHTPYWSAWDRIPPPLPVWLPGSSSGRPEYLKCCHSPEKPAWFLTLTWPSTGCLVGIWGMNQKKIFLSLSLTPSLLLLPPLGFFLSLCPSN